MNGSNLSITVCRVMPLGLENASEFVPSDHENHNSGSALRNRHRGNQLAMLLMYAAFRWVEAHGGTHVVAIGRNEVLELYHRVGLQSFGLQTKAGTVVYDLMHAEVGEMQSRVKQFSALFEQIEE